ncbi:MAG TPA: 6-pyruvoyl-tetrahydropterin synthase-related protein [Anaerolineae bacterium]|nr:6-pyruvoyl-tetrahydropterin synthase-related protein [Anaerolineae bacterium]
MHWQTRVKSAARGWPVTSTALGWFSVGLIVAIVVQPLLATTPRGDDTLLHYYRVPLINSLLRQGALYSRWAPDLVFGYGYPLFNFYPPFSAYLLTASYWLAGENAWLGWNLASGLILIVTGLGMFLLGRRLFGLIGGVFAAAAYVLAPHVLYQTFQRGSLSNALALACLPFALLALIDLARMPSVRRWALAALALAAILLSHLVTGALLVIPLAALGLLAALLQRGEGKARVARVSVVGLAVAAGLSLAAFSWLPALAEIQFTHYSTAVSKVDFTQFFADLFRWPAPAVDGLANPGLPLSVGVGQLVLGSIGFGWAAWLGLARRNRRSGADDTDAIIALSGILAVSVTFLATPLSAWFWENLSILDNFQFPVRLLDVGAFLFPLACGWLAKRFVTAAWRRVAIGGLGLIVFYANAVPYLYPLRWQTGLPARPTLADVTRQAQVQYGIYGLTSWGEYMPSTARTWPVEPPFPGADLGATLDQKLISAGLPAGSVIQASGGPTHAAFQLDLPDTTTLTFYTFYFPGWAAQIDGRAAPIGPDTAGRLTVSVPAGEHRLTIYFGETPVRSVSDGISILAALLIALASLFPRRIFAPQVAAKGTLEPPDRPVEKVNRVDMRAAVFCGLLLILALYKFIWLDHFDSAWVHHFQNGALADTLIPAWSEFGAEVKLVGYRLEAPDALTLYWQARQVPTRNYRVEILLSDARGAARAKVVRDTPGHNLASRWEPFQLVRDEYRLPLDATQRPIGYRLSVALVDPATDQAAPLLDSPQAAEQSSPVGTTKLAPLPVSTDQTAQPVNAIFADKIELAQARVPDQVVAGTTFTYTLTWKSRAVVAEDYTVFAHLINTDETPASANDAQPRGGLYPTSFWSPGEEIVDERSWSVSLAPGHYRLEVGLYRLDTGERLAVTGGAPGSETRVLLKDIEVTTHRGMTR